MSNYFSTLEAREIRQFIIIIIFFFLVFVADCIQDET